MGLVSPVRTSEQQNLHCRAVVSVYIYICSVLLDCFNKMTTSAARFFWNDHDFLHGMCKVIFRTAKPSDDERVVLHLEQRFGFCWRKMNVLIPVSEVRFYDRTNPFETLLLSRTAHWKCSTDHGVHDVAMTYFVSSGALNSTHSVTHCEDQN